MYAVERHRAILRYLESEPVVRARQLQQEFDVTAMTIWRDLTELERQGLLKRTRGGAVRVATHLREEAFSAKVDQAQHAKERIAAYAVAHFMQEGDILIIDGGTTTAALVRQPLPAGLTVLTNSLPVANLLQQHRAAPSVYLCGGLIRTESGTLVGREALSFFSRRHAASLFLSTTALDAEAGVTDPNPQEIEVKQAMAGAARQVILLADASKLNKVSLMQTFPWRRVSHWITDVNPEACSQFRKSISVFPEVHHAS